MTEKDIQISAEKAKTLHKVDKDGSFKNKVKELKQFFIDNGLSNGVLRIQLFCENKEDKKETLSAIEFTDKGSMLYHTEWF